MAALSNVSQNPSRKLDEALVLLEKAKVEEDESAELKFIRDFRVHPKNFNCTGSWKMVGRNSHVFY